MKKEIISHLRTLFEDCAHEIDGLEVWFARDLQNLLVYSDWRNFLNVIEKAKLSCSQSGELIQDHFVGVTKKVKIGSDAMRSVDDIMLTRYACYLIAQNGDPQKEKIAFAQSYFAVQTRKQEIIEERIALVERLSARRKLVASETEFSKLIYERGVDEMGFSRIRSKGDQALFGGITTSAMKKMLNVSQKRPLADFLPTITITAKNLATEITNFNVQRDDLQGESLITNEHVRNNSDVRNLLSKSGIKPEELSAEQDIKKLVRNVSKNESSVLEDVKKERIKEDE